MSDFRDTRTDPNYQRLDAERGWSFPDEPSSSGRRGFGGRDWQRGLLASIVSWLANLVRGRR